MAILLKFSSQEKERSTIHRIGTTEKFLWRFILAQHNGELDAVVKRKGMFGEFAPYDFEGEGKK